MFTTLLECTASPNISRVSEWVPYDLREIRHLLSIGSAFSVCDLYLPVCRILWWHIAHDLARNAVPAALSRTIGCAALTTVSDKSGYSCNVRARGLLGHLHGVCR